MWSTHLKGQGATAEKTNSIDEDGVGVVRDGQRVSRLVRRLFHSAANPALFLCAAD